MFRLFLKIGDGDRGYAAGETERGPVFEFAVANRKGRGDSLCWERCGLSFASLQRQIGYLSGWPTYI